MKRLHLTITAVSPPERADQALKRLLPEVGPALLRETFARRDVKRNDQRIRQDAVLMSGDNVTLYLPNTFRPLDTIMEDSEYIVVNKRQGMPTQGEASVEAVYARHYGSPIHACHRLDVQTGGLLLLAKTEMARQRAQDAFAAHLVEKRYQAIVCGIPRPKVALLHAYLLKDAAAARVRILSHPSSGAKPITTEYRVLSSADGLSCVEIQLVTGRTHQIRAHLAFIGCPILGDDKYGDRALNREHGARRQMLWATQLMLWDGRTFSVRPPF